MQKRASEVSGEQGRASVIWRALAAIPSSEGISQSHWPGAQESAPKRSVRLGARQPHVPATHHALPSDRCARTRHFGSPATRGRRGQAAPSPEPTSSGADLRSQQAPRGTLEPSALAHAIRRTQRRNGSSPGIDPRTQARHDHRRGRRRQNQNGDRTRATPAGPIPRRHLAG